MKKVSRYFSCSQVTVITGFLAFICFSSVSLAAPPNIRGDGKLAVFNYHTEKYEDVTFREGSKYDAQALAKLEEVFAGRDGVKGKIDRRLFDLIDNIQDHFCAETVELISGYRSPALNKTIRTNGGGAIEKSLHMQGVASDIHLDEANEQNVFEYTKSLQAGGVGLYENNLFVHVDLGPKRYWSDRKLSERTLIGTENNPNNEWILTTDKNEYTGGDRVSIQIKNNAYKKLKMNTKRAYFELFRKGKWAVHEKIALDGKLKKLSPSETGEVVWQIPSDALPGKYRLVFFPSGKSVPAYSNEFYLRDQNACHKN